MHMSSRCKRHTYPCCNQAVLFVNQPYSNESKGRMYVGFHINATTAFAKLKQLNLNDTYSCTHMCVLTCLTHAKLQKLVCAHTVACSFGMCMLASERMRHKRDACTPLYKFALGLPHYMYGVATGTVAVGNEMQLYCS